MIKNVDLIMMFSGLLFILILDFLILFIILKDSIAEDMSTEDDRLKGEKK